MNGKKNGKRARIITRIVIVVAIISVCMIGGKRLISLTLKKNQPEIITKATLEKIIDVSDMSTFEAVYNGVAKVMNEKNADKVDYYVSYEAKVKAGFDVEKVQLDIDNDINVDIASLDYIFMNDKANVSTVSEQAYKKCIEDVERESSSENAIYTLAGQNAKDVITALVNPFIEQLENDYELIVEIEGVDDNEENN